MDFRTIVKPIEKKGIINHQNPIILMGSCFTDNIGKKLQDALFDVDINPTGILYNPASIANAINEILINKQYTAKDLFQRNDDSRYYSYNHHSDFSSINKDRMLENINNRISEANKIIKQPSTLIITFGTAYIYCLKETGSIVANCHKQPASMFDRRMLSIDEIVTMWDTLISKLKDTNPSLNIIFTVSPIRHLADGAHDNQLSKSTLLLSIAELCKKYSDIIYFPSYEILLDDLRDYRFYTQNMTHPSSVAVDYIYSIFSQSFFDKNTIQLAEECESITRHIHHKHRTDDINIIISFNTKTQDIINSLLNKHPYLIKPIQNSFKNLN